MRMTEQHYNTLTKLNAKSCMAKDMAQGGMSQMARHLDRWLADMLEMEYVVFLDPLWHITELGRQKLISHNTHKLAMLKHKNKTSVYDLGIYQTPKNVNYRPGSLDFLKCKSLIGDKSFDAKTSLM